ncbi:hypothetical protein E3T55_03655 [Cryobacterium frigoriphilum]|uniref:Thioredoxin domain-containing protein n=1 Tax=Cryobacterium frigoriphilum TaxID=1259150 RepID=A0A4R9A993_9MICO|nr:hypothetical protein [Cryobacterium frigoriphilum]TFD54526.1 hypothetical protein E3T55_03655 [Cryobacterium frigoriphilum]
MALSGGALAAVLLLSGCGGPAAPGEVPPAALVNGVDCQAPNLSESVLVYPSAPGLATDVPLHPDAPAAGDVPAGFEPVTLIRCTFMDTVEDEQGLWSAVTVETLTGDFARLLTALAEPDDEPGFNQACTADMEFVPVLWLENAAGDAMRVAWPMTSCNKTKPATHEVVDSFTVTATQKLPLALITTREALDAGCTMQASIPLFGGLQNIEYPPLVDANDATPGSAPTASAAPAAGELCLYTVDPGAGELEPIPGADAEMQQQLQDSAVFIVSGSFVGAAPLPAATIALIEGAASGAGVPAVDCDTLATRFGQLGSAETIAPITVELDGCERVFGATGTAYETPAELAAALAGV